MVRSPARWSPTVSQIAKASRDRQHLQAEVPERMVSHRA